jgi:hypothetical protein
MLTNFRPVRFVTNQNDLHWYDKVNTQRRANELLFRHSHFSVSAHSFIQSKQRRIWGFHGGDYEECGLLGYKNQVRTSQETHYVSTTDSSQLMLCKIWGCHGSDYEECRLLGYKKPVRTSKETHYFSATKTSRLMLCKIWGSHGGDCEECRPLWCDAVWLL